MENAPISKTSNLSKDFSHPRHQHAGSCNRQVPWFKPNRNSLLLLTSVPRNSAHLIRSYHCHSEACFPQDRGTVSIGWLGIAYQTSTDPFPLPTATRKAPKIILFKVAHHGSMKSDQDEIWNELLDAKPISAVTPCKIGGNDLPLAEDIQRIKANSSRSFITSSKKKISNSEILGSEMSSIMKSMSNGITNRIFDCGSVCLTYDAKSGLFCGIKLENGAKEL